MSTAAPRREALARSLTEKLTRKGYQALWAGGCVRDMLLGRTPNDIDIATSARPEDIERIFPQAQGVGKSFGVMIVPLEDTAFEIATFRKEGDYLDGRHPSSIEFTSAEQDAKRRDFTVNGLFFDPIKNKILDYVDGQRDLKAKLIRAIGDPNKRFQEDHLRLLRAPRFASTLAWDIEVETLLAVKQNASAIQSVSSERIASELTKLLTESPQAGKGLHLLHQTKLLAEILPEIEACIGVEQPPAFHPEGDVFVHTAMMLDLMPTPADPVLAYATLLHDVGKPPTAAIGPGADGIDRIRFDRHAEVGARMTEAILTRLRLPAKLIDQIVYCVKNHMRFGDVQAMRKATLRRLMGAPTFATELILHRLDCSCSHGNLSNFDFLRELQATFKAEPVLPPRWITGRDVMELGLKEGPDIGVWLKKTYDRQLGGEAKNREELLSWLREQLA